MCSCLTNGLWPSFLGQHHWGCRKIPLQWQDFNGKASAFCLQQHQLQHSVLPLVPGSMHAMAGAKRVTACLHEARSAVQYSEFASAMYKVAGRVWGQTIQFRLWLVAISHLLIFWCVCVVWGSSLCALFYFVVRNLGISTCLSCVGHLVDCIELSPEAQTCGCFISRRAKTLAIMVPPLLTV